MKGNFEISGNLEENLHRERRYQEFPPDLFDRRDIIALAETEHGAHNKVIIDFLDRFIDKINGVFIELPLNYQQSVDRYLAEGKVDEALDNLFVGAEKEGKNIRGLLAVFDRIKISQKPIICFDSSKKPEGEYQIPSSYGRYYLRGKSRDDDMFHVLEDGIKANPGKYLLIGGENHFIRGQHPQSGDTTLGQKLQEAFGDKFEDFSMKIDEKIEEN